VLSFFFAKRIGALAGDLDSLIQPLYRYLSKYSLRRTSSVAERLYRGLKGGVFPSSRSIDNLCGPWSARREASPSENTSARCLYHDGKVMEPSENEVGVTRHT